MKKILITISLILIAFLASCEKEEELENKNLTFTNQDIVIKSFFNDSEMVINLDIYDAKDADDYCNGFYYKGNYNDFLIEIEKNEYYYETLDGNGRFYCDNQFYIVQLIEQYGDCFLCKILSEYVIFSDYSVEPNYRIAIPMPRFNESDECVGYSSYSQIDVKYFEYLKKYYSNQLIFNVEVSDSIIKIIDFIPANENVGLCDISIIKGDYITIEVDVK